MSSPPPRRVTKVSVPAPANDHAPADCPLTVKVLIPQDLPISQAEIEVFAALLENLTANDNEAP